MIMYQMYLRQVTPAPASEFGESDEGSPQGGPLPTRGVLSLSLASMLLIPWSLVKISIVMYDAGIEISHKRRQQPPTKARLSRLDKL